MIPPMRNPLRAKKISTPKFPITYMIAGADGVAWLTKCTMSTGRMAKHLTKSKLMLLLCDKTVPLQQCPETI